MKLSHLLSASLLLAGVLTTESHALFGPSCDKPSKECKTVSGFRSFVKKCPGAYTACKATLQRSPACASQDQSPVECD